MTNLHVVYKYERPQFLIETTSVLGFTFGGGNLDWTILDLAVARVFGFGDLSPYLGGGVGVHTVRVEHEVRVLPPEGGYEYAWTNSQSATAPTADLVVGVLGMRTFDFEVIVEARYRHVFEDFDRVGGKGAHGFQLAIGTSR